MHVLNEAVIGGGSVDGIYPVGSLFLGEGLNPNELFKKTVWVRRGQGRVLVGVDEDDADFGAARKTGGEKAHSLTEAELPGHSHPFTGTAVATSTLSHTHSVYSDTAPVLNSWTPGWSMNSNAPAWQSGVASTAGSHSHTLAAGGAANAVGNTGSGAAHNNLQPFMVCDIWERVV